MRWGVKGRGAESAPTQWQRVDLREKKHPENTTRRDRGGQGKSTMNQGASELKDIALHTDNIGLFFWFFFVWIFFGFVFFCFGFFFVVCFIFGGGNFFVFVLCVCVCGGKGFF